MSQWFRMYAEVLDDPKVQRLSGDDFKAWVNILCLTAKHDGALPPADDIAFALRIDIKKLAKLIDRLSFAGLIVETETGLKPNQWDARQYKSDVSTERVKRFRERSTKRIEAATETPPDTETEQRDTLPNGNAASDDSDKAFWDGAKSYLASENRAPGALIGKWVRDFGKTETAGAITRAQLERPVQKIPFIIGALKSRAHDPTKLEFGPC